MCYWLYTHSLVFCLTIMFRVILTLLSFFILSMSALAGPVDGADIELPPEEPDVTKILSVPGLKPIALESLVKDPVVTLQSDSKDAFSGGDSALDQWSRNYLLSAFPEDEPKAFLVVFKVLGLFIVLLVVMVVARMLKLRKMRARPR